jgi:iron complex transport system substrate-binding protein
MTFAQRAFVRLGLVLALTMGALPAFSESSGGAAGFTVVDSLGRTVSFPRPPERIVLTGKAVIMIADALYMFPEASSRIAAMGRTAQGKLDFIPAIDPDYGKKTILESQAGPEQIAAARPDAVLLKSSVAQSLGKSVEALGVPVVYLDFETPQQYERDLLTLGLLLGNESRARELIAGFRRRTERTAEALAGMKEEDRPRVLLVYYTDQGGAAALNVPPLGWMQTLLVRMAGGRPVWKDARMGQGWTKVSIEQIAAWDPDQIYVIAYANDTTAVVTGLAEDQQWRGLRAVKRGALRAFPADFYGWDQPDPRWILGLTWLAAKVNPDRFPGLDMPREIRSFYKEFFGLDDEAFLKIVQPALSGVLP